MKTIYEEPFVMISDLVTEGFLCASGKPECYIFPIEADVAPYIDNGTGTEDFGDVIL